MYKAKIFGEEIRITNEVYKNLIDRFNPENLDEGGENKTSCTACNKYSSAGCGNHPRCPFAAFEENDFGPAPCGNLIRRLLNKHSKKSTFTCGQYAVEAHTVAQRGQMAVLHREITSLFKRVE